MEGAARRDIHDPGAETAPTRAGPSQRPKKKRFTRLGAEQPEYYADEEEEDDESNSTHPAPRRDAHLMPWLCLLLLGILLVAVGGIIIIVAAPGYNAAAELAVVTQSLQHILSFDHQPFLPPSPTPPPPPPHGALALHRRGVATAVRNLMGAL